MNNNDNILYLNFFIFNSGNRKNKIVDDMCQKVNICNHRMFSNRKNSISETLSQIHEAKAIILLGQNNRLIFAKRTLLDDLFKELDDFILFYDYKVIEYNLLNIYKDNN